MTTAPLIVIPGRRKAASQVEGFPSSFTTVDIDLYFADYGKGVIEWGGIPIYVPFGVDAVDIISRADGLLLPGGADLDPGLYGAESETDQFPVEPVRDRFELDLLDAAIAKGKPVLGICRGHQLLNVHAGGTLHQDVPPHSRFDLAPETEIHDVTFEPGSILGGLYGPERSVNSLHHQTIDRLGDGYTVTGRSEDGTIEGLEHLELPIVSVQWHPEMMTTRPDDPLFGWLIDLATR